MTLTGYIVGAKGNTGRSISGVTENNDYTITISFTDGTTFTTEPIPGFTSVDLDENFDLVVTKTDGTEVTVETGLGEYNTTLSGYKTDAENAATSAGNSKDAASGSATTATQQATLARSYAKGDTSSRTGEATDNAEYFKGQASDSATSASSSASTAEAQALVSEGYAQGTQVSTPVTSDSPYYHNNSKYFSELASASDTSAASSASSANTDALKAEGYAVGKQNGTTQTGGTYYHNNAQYYNSQATQAASISATQATASGTQALKSEGFAVGEQSGTPVTSGSDYYENNAKYYAGEAADSATAAAGYAESIDPDTLAKIDGYYQEMTVGDAEQIVSSILVEDKAPYKFRTAGGSVDIGKRAYFDAIVGGTVGWNQLAPAVTSDKWGGNDSFGTTTFNSGKVTYTITVKNDSQSVYVGNSKGGVPLIKGHKHFVCFDITSTQAVSGTGFRAQVMNSQWVIFNALSANTKTKASSVFESTNETGGNAYFGIYPSVGGGLDVGESITVEKVMVIDLTQMFGSTIADYIYSLEQANAGAGVAFFRKYFPNSYYPYNAGELVSVSGLSAHKTTGFNQWDEVAEYGGINSTDGENITSSTTQRSANFIPVLPNTTYYLKSAQKLYYRFYDADKNYIGQRDANNLASGYNTTMVTPTSCAYFRFVTDTAIASGSICINLSWDGSRDGEYEEYKEHTYPLDDSLTLRGIPKLLDGKLQFDGDEYYPIGTVIRRYGVVDLGSLDWARGSDTFFQVVFQNAKPTTLNLAVYGKDYAPKATYNEIYSTDKTIFVNANGVMYIRDDTYTDAASFKTAMDGVYLAYELATPTTEEAEAYNGIQIVDDFGTEEFITDTVVPVGHVTHYPVNLVAKLEMMPNSPDGNGDYIVQQASGINTYIPLASTDTITNIIARLEALEGGGE